MLIIYFPDVQLFSILTVDGKSILTIFHCLKYSHLIQSWRDFPFEMSEKFFFLKKVQGLSIKVIWKENKAQHEWKCLWQKYFKEQNESDNNLITIKVHEHMTCLTLFLWLLEFVVSAPSGKIAIFGPHCLECRWKMSFFCSFFPTFSQWMWQKCFYWTCVCMDVEEFFFISICGCKRKLSYNFQRMREGVCAFYHLPV